MRGLIHKANLYLARSSPTILSCIGAVGVIATTVLAVKETPKAVELIKADSRRNHDGDPDAYTKIEAVKSCWHCYIPAAAVGVSTIVCILGANVLNKRQQAAITSAYMLVNNAYKEYRDKVKEIYGNEVDSEIRGMIAKDKYEESDIEVSDRNLLFYDQYSGRYFERTMAEVIDAEYHINRKFNFDDYVRLNDFYKLLGLPETDFGNLIGWSIGAGYNTHDYQWIDFDHELVIMEDGLECYIISSPTDPTTDYKDYC